MMVMVVFIASEGSEVDTTKAQFQLGNINAAIAIHIDSAHQPLHLPWRKIGNVGVFESFLELIGVNFTGLVQVDGIKETKHRLVRVMKIVGQHEQLFWALVMMIVMRVEVMVRMVHFVNHGSTCHEEHSLGHGVVEQMEQSRTESHHHDAVVQVVVRVLRAISEVFVPVQGVCKVKRRSKASEDVGQLGHGRIGEDLFQVMLDKRNGRCHNGGGSTNSGDDKGQIRQFTMKCFCSKEWEHACYEVKSSVNHGSGVDKSRNGGWTFHGVRQPNVERELRRFTHCTNEHEPKSPRKCART